jgi:hypothetical protein
MSSARFRPARTTMPLRSSPENPCSSALTTYSPGGRSISRYVPAVSLTASKVPATVGLLAASDTPGRTAPCSSLITPRIEPFTVVWPSAALEPARRHTRALATQSRRELVVMEVLLRRGSRRCRATGTKVNSTLCRAGVPHGPGWQVRECGGFTYASRQSSPYSERDLREIRMRIARSGAAPLS